MLHTLRHLAERGHRVTYTRAGVRRGHEVLSLLFSLCLGALCDCNYDDRFWDIARYEIRGMSFTVGGANAELPSVKSAVADVILSWGIRATLYEL